MLRLKLDDFVVHKGNEVVFEDGKVYVVYGENGAGKSTIIEALLWCLYGYTIRGGGSERIPGLVSIEIKAHPGELIITRRKPEKGTELLSMFLNNKNITYKALRDTQAEIHKFFGEVDTFLHTQIYSADGYTFSSMTDAERKEVLRKLLNLEVIAKARQLVRTDLTAKTTQRQSEEVKLNLKTERIREIEQLIGELQKRLKEQEAVKNNSDKIEQEIREKMTSINETLINLEGELGEINEEIELADQKIDKYQSEYTRHQSTIASLSKELSMKQSTLQRIQDNLLKLKGKATCPLCNQPMQKDPAVLWQPEISELSDSIKNLENELKTYQRMVNEVYEKLTELKSYKDELMSKRRAIIQKQTALNSSLTTLNDQLQKAQVELSKIQTTIAGIEGQIKQLETELNTLQAEVKSTSLNIDQLKKDEGMLSILYDVFGNEGLPAWMITEFVKRLEIATNKYLKLLPTAIPLEVNISTVEQLKGGSVRDRLTIIPSTGGGKVSMVSGGEKKRIDTALLLGLRDVIGMNEWNLPVFFDEVFDRLDEEGADAVAELLSDYADITGTAVVVIGHSKDILGLFPDAIPIEVIREGSKSRIVMG